MCTPSMIDGEGAALPSIQSNGFNEGTFDDEVVVVMYGTYNQASGGGWWKLEGRTQNDVLIPTQICVGKRSAR